MSRRRHTPEQVVRKLREADRLISTVAGLRGDLSPLAESVQQDEGRRRQASEGGGGRERKG